MRGLGIFRSASARNTAPRTRRARFTALLVMAAMVAPGVLGAVAPAWAAPSGPALRAIAVFDAFEDVPDDAYFAAQGLEVQRRLFAIPGVIVGGPESGLLQVEGHPDLDYVERDRPQEYFLSTAVFSTNAADVWGDAWWPVASEVQRKTPSPLTLDGNVIDGSGVVVAVVDSGINAAHPDLWYAPAHAGAMPWEPKVLACVNVPDVIDVADQPYCDETVGHGTHVAGIVAGNAFAARNGMATGVDPDHPPMGAAPGAKLVGFGLGAGLFIVNAVAALDYVAEHHQRWGIRVVTNSWGGAGSCSQGLPGSSVISISNRLIDDGITVLFANGNYDVQGNPTWSSPHATNPKPGLIGVANYNDQGTGTRDGAVSGSSSDGCVTSGGSPGDLLWTWPDVAAPGSSITSTAAWTGSLIPPTNGGFYGTASGTSMATPHVAGIVALMLEANPALTPAQVERILIETATPWGDGTGARGVGGTTMWGPSAVNNPVAGFADPGLCRVTPADAAKAKLGDTSVNAKFPLFTTLAQVTDADLFVCRDFKRGRGLVDAYAAVQRALDLRGDAGGSPAVTIESPEDGAQVAAGIVGVSGLVDRAGGAANAAPTAGLGADKVSGAAPLDVTFTLLGSDSDGSVASWSIDFGDGSAPATGTTLPASQVHTYGANGDFTATLTVVDDEGAQGTAALDISVGGLPVPDGTYTGSIFAYQLGAIGVSNVGAIIVGAATGDDVPKYAAGEVVGAASRSTIGPGLTAATPAQLEVYDAGGALVLGPLPMTGSPEDPTLAGCTDCYSYDTANFQIPLTFGGRYLLAVRLAVGGANAYVFDDAYGGLKPIDVVGAGLVAAEPPPLPGSWADLDGPASRDAPPVAFGSREDPEVTDPGDDTTGDLAFVDVRKLWVGLETSTTFDIHLLVDDLSQQPPSVDASTPGGRVRVAVNYGTEFCLDNNLNAASGDGTFCYRFAAVNAATGAVFSGGVIQRDGSGSCGLADLVEGGAFDIANDTVSWRLRRAAFDVTQNSADVAACTTAPIVRGGDPVRDGDTLSLLEGSTGFSAGARIIFTTGIGGDSTDPNNARPYTFGGPSEPLAAEAGGPYAGMPGEAVSIAGSASGGAPPYSCAWTGAGTFDQPGACLTTVTFAAAGQQTITLTITDSAGGSASDTATVDVGSPSGERVALFLDMEGAPRATVSVSTSDADPSEAWSSSLDLTGLAGPHTITARWFDASDALLDSASVGITVQGQGAEAFVRIDTPAHDPTGQAPLGGVIALEGEAGHVGAMGQLDGPPGFRTSLSGLRPTVREGRILAPCSGCEGSPATNPSLATSVSWLGSDPGGDTDGVDGVWLGIAGFDGASYALDAEFGSPMDLYFFNDVLDPQSQNKGSKTGATMPKTGTVPADANWAFVYLRRPGTNLLDLEGFDDTAIMTLTLGIVPPGPPQLLEATPGVGDVTLNWLAPVEDGGEPLAAYKVYRDGALVTTLPGSALAFTDTPLTPGQEFSFEVSAANSAGEGPRAGPVKATPLADQGEVPLAITHPADGATGVAGTTGVDGTYTPRGTAEPPPPGSGNFANTHYFFLMNLNNVKCSEDLGHGDILIASKLWFHARDVLGVPDANLRFFNENGKALCRADDPANHDQLPPEWQEPNNPFDGPARMSAFVPSLRQAAQAAVDGELANGAPARIFITQSSHGIWSPSASHVTGSLMALNGESVQDRTFGDAITAAVEDAEAGTGVAIEVLVTVDCSFCGGFGDSPLWFPGTTTTAVDSAKVVGPNRVVEVGCTWITECFGNPAVAYDHFYNECVFTGKADGYGPAVPPSPVPNPLPDGSGDVGEDVVLGDPDHHARDGVVTFEEAYWCGLENVKSTLDIIGIQQVFQLIDQMDADLFQSDGFILWDVNRDLGLKTRDPDAPLPPVSLDAPRTTAPDDEGDALTPFGDLLQLDATATETKVVLDLKVGSLLHAAAGVEDYVEYIFIVNDSSYGVCHDRGTFQVYDYTAGAYLGAADGTVAYDLASGLVHVELRIGALQDATMPANVWARSRYTNCTTASAPQDDDRVPDAGTISTGSGPDPDPGTNEVRLRLDGPGASLLQGLAVLDPGAKTWTFDPAGDLAEGTYTATAEHWFDDGSGMARVEGPVSITFTVGNPDVTPPTAPADLFVAGTTSTTASLTWSAATDDEGVARYNVYRAGAPGVEAIPANLAGSTTGLTFTDTGLAPSTDYHYAVEAEDAAGNRGPLSNEELARTQSPPPVTEKVTLSLDGAFLEDIAVDTVAGGDPAAWATTLDTATIANGFHDLVAAYDDGRGNTAGDSTRFYVSNDVALTIASPAQGDAVSEDFTVSGTADGAPDGSVVQVQPLNAAGQPVRDWIQASFDGAAWSHALEGMPFGDLTIEARLLDGSVVLATDSVGVRVHGRDRILITEANGQAVGDAVVGPLSGTVPVEGTSSLAPEADPRANVPPVAVISEAVVVGKALSASGSESHDPDGSIVAWAWDLGDGSKRSGALLGYAYAEAGAYTVTLSVTDDKGAVGQAQMQVETTDEQPADFIVDAGDSQFVRLGEPLALVATPYGGQAPLTYAWDTDMDGAFDRSGQTIQVATTGLPGGPRTYTVAAVDALGGKALDSVQVFLYDPVTEEHVFSELVPAGLPDELVGLGGTDQGDREHSVEVSAGSPTIDAVLTWTVYAPVLEPGTPVFGDGGPNDFDLFLHGPDGLELSSADFNMPEEIHVPEPDAGTYTFEVVPFLVVPDTYTLTVAVGVAPPNPVPRADQVTDVCFEGATQLLEASATVATGEAIAGAWDTDFDGAFDDGTGFAVGTSFPQDGQAHLVRFRATTEAGFRATALLGVRPMLDCPDSPGVVVVGIADTGINPYHREFAGELVPDAALRSYTTVDPDIALPDDGRVRHKVNGQMLPFTRHPSRYIPGYPGDSAALQLTLGGGFHKALDDAAVWSKGHAAVPMGKWFWIPGTKIVAAMDLSDAGAINSGPDTTPILDDDGHGSGSAAVAVGNLVGSCPRCVLAFVEGLNGDTILMQQEWIDFVSFSFGSVGNIGTPLVSVEEASKAAAERGMTISYAAGNGLDLSFLTPEQTYLSNSLGPDWTVDVGAVDKASNSVILGTGKPVDWSSYGLGNIPGACINNYQGNCGHSGTSAATPIATGHMANVLLTVRKALGDGDAGPKDPAKAGGQRQAIAVGEPIPGSPWLGDGVLQRHELWDVAFHCASQFGTSAGGVPVRLPRSQVDYVYGGYGVADAAMGTCALNALLTGAAIPAKPDADAFYEADEAIRDALWGDWDGDGDGQPGGNHNTAASPIFPRLQGLNLADVDTDAEVSRLWRDLMADLGRLDAAPGYTEAYWLHRTGGCSGAANERDFMDMVDSPGDEDGCGAVGTAPLLGESVGPSASYPSDVATGGFEAGAQVSGRLYLDYIHPGAPSVQLALLSNGVEVGRSAVLMPLAPGGFGLLGFTEYAFTMVTTAPVAAGDFLQLDVFITGSESFFVGYEGDHASRFTITGVGGTGDPLGVAIASPGQGASFDKATTGSVAVSGTSTGADRVEAAIDDASFASGRLAVSGIASWSATWDLAGANPGPHTLYARACQGPACSAAASRGVFVEDSLAPPPREGSVEVQFVPAGHAVEEVWNQPLRYDAGTGDWAYDWDTGALANGDWDFHARLVSDGTEVAHDAFRANLRNSRAPVLETVGDQRVVEGNTLSFGLSASDLDGDALRFSMSGAPQGASLEDHGDGTATFAWLPRFDQQGSYEVTFEVSDGGASDAEAITLTADDARAALLGAGGFALVQGALDEALEGDSVVVLPGTHDEAVTLAMDGVTLCSTAASVRLPADVRCIANAAGAVLDAATISADRVTVKDLTLRSGTGPGLEAAATSADASLRGLVLDGAGGALLRGAGHALAGNRYEGLGTALEVRGQDVRAEHETFQDVGTVLALDTGSQPTGNVLTRSCVDGATTLVRLASGVAGVTVDARGNDWGLYTESAISARVVDEGTGNTALLYPWLAEDCATPLLRPTAMFSRTPDPVYALVDTIAFTDESTTEPGSRDIVGWAWEFGDGFTSDEQHPSHVYAEPGTYTASLTARDAAELEHATSAVLELLRWFPPDAALDAAPNPTDRLTAVRFTDLSAPGTGTIEARLLEFGDGASSTQTTTQHTYAALGTFTATLTLTDNKDQVSTSTVDIEVLNIPPVAAGSADKTETDRLTPVNFEDASTDADGSVVAWLWDFGDGTTSTEQHPSHTYAKLGTFKVDLTATDNDSGTHTAEVAKVKVKNLKPQAQAAAPPAEANRVDAVQFDDQSSDRDGSVVAWAWDFGDGTTSTEQHPSHTYASLGTYDVTLEVTDDDGDRDAVTVGTITVVNLAPAPAFAMDPEHPNILLPVRYEDLSTDRDGAVVAWAWEFGDTGTSTEQDPVHVYLNGGFHDVNLTVTDNDGGNARVSKRIFVCAPGLDLQALMELEHVRLEFEACLRFTGLEVPFVG